MYVCIYLSFVALLGPSLVATSGGSSSLQSFSPWRSLSCSTGSRHPGSGVGAGALLLPGTWGLPGPGSICTPALAGTFLQLKLSQAAAMLLHRPAAGVHPRNICRSPPRLPGGPRNIRQHARWLQTPTPGAAPREPPAQTLNGEKVHWAAHREHLPGSEA